MFQFLLLAVLATSCYAGIVPVAPAAYVANYATAYNAHVINHAIAAPVAAAPLVAAHAPLAYAPYSAYSAYPYAAAYQSPLVVAK